MCDTIFNEVFSTARPGSRTLLFGAQDLQTVQSFARRGFRLFLVVLEDDEFLQEVKSHLRGAGLSSQLMGGTVWKNSLLSLAKDFYELAVVCQDRMPESDVLSEALQIGSEVYWTSPGWTRNDDWQLLDSGGGVWNRARLTGRLKS